ncbi:MAG: glycosyltransferase family 2 protein [Gemmataceae bacterium]|nr:glycosyltransferase family 2 protein [Gemmataceae bacterium]
MIVTTICVMACVLAAIPAYMYLRNGAYYVTPPGPGDGEPHVSVLIPARNEEASIGPAIESALVSRDVEVEVVVLDDHSTDETAGVVRAAANQDSRVRLLQGAELPPGWSGKQHACYQLALAAQYDIFVFLDADVRLEHDGLARLVAFQLSSRADLVSGVPRQITGTLLEKLVIPLIHFLLLGYLPVWIMRMINHPALGAGCGQLFLTTRAGYAASNGHAAIRDSFHDGVKLPRAYRRAGLRTDLCDATQVASCRMYHSAGQLWNGLAKNAGEGIGSAAAIVPWTVLLGGGAVLPFFLAMGYKSLAVHQRWPVVAACLLALLPRLLAVRRFHQSLLGAILHPVGIFLLLAIQWYALARRLIGRPVGWKGRVQPPIMDRPSDGSDRCR